MRKIFLITGLFFITGIVNSQHTAQKIRMVIDITSSADIKSLPEDPWQSSILSLETKDYMGNPDKKFLFEQKRKISELYPRKKTDNQQKSGGTPPPPIINAGFNGNPFNNSVPLDNYLAVSDSNKIVSVSNVMFRVYEPDGSNILSKTLQSFCTPSNLTGVNNGKFDPKVVYDPIADRFIAVILNGFNSNYSKIVVAFSQTNKPEGVWNFYVLPGNPFNDTTWFDYPAINITDNEVFITGNQIKENVSWQLGFKQTVIWQIRKKEGYAGLPLVTDLWNNIQYNNRNIRNLHPVKWGSDIEGPKQYFLSNRNFDIQNDTIFIVSVSDTIDSPNAAMDIDVIIADRKYGVPPHGKQKGINRYAATNDGRVLAAFYKNNKIQIATNCIDTSNGRSGLFLGIIDGVDNQNYNISSTIISNDTLDFGYPNISWVGDGANGSQSIISFEHTGENRFPGISTMFYDGVAYSDMITVKEGQGNLVVLSDTIERWGDYFGSQPIYNRNGRVWIAGTYGNLSNRHQTWIAQLDNPFGVETSVENININEEHQPLIYPNPSNDMTYIKVNLNKSGLTKVELADINGKIISSLFEGNAKQGWNQFSFNAQSLTAGTYILFFYQTDTKMQSVKFIRD